VTARSGEETQKSPETQPEYVKDELDQDLVTHQGEQRRAPSGQAKPGGQHLGAVEDEQTPIIPPMSGPADLVGEEDVDGQGNESGHTEIGEELFDPRDELTPG
jgi:hypothetical protein